MLIIRHGATGKADHASLLVADGENHPIAQQIKITPILRGAHQSQDFQPFDVLGEGFFKMLPTVWGKTQGKFFDSVRRQTTFEQIMLGKAILL